MIYFSLYAVIETSMIPTMIPSNYIIVFGTIGGTILLLMLIAVICITFFIVGVKGSFNVMYWLVQSILGYPNPFGLELE